MCGRLFVVIGSVSLSIIGRHGLPIVIGNVSLSIICIHRHSVVTLVVIHPVVTICWGILVVILVIMGRDRDLRQPLHVPMPQLPQLKGALDPEASLLPCLGFRPVHVIPVRAQPGCNGPMIGSMPPAPMEKLPKRSCRRIGGVAGA